MYNYENVVIVIKVNIGWGVRESNGISLYWKGFKKSLR